MGTYCSDCYNCGGSRSCGGYTQCTQVTGTCSDCINAYIQRAGYVCLWDGSRCNSFDGSRQCGSPPPPPPDHCSPPLPYSASYSTSFDICCSHSTSYSSSNYHRLSFSTSNDVCFSTTAPSFHLFIPATLSSIAHSSSSNHIQPAAALVSSSHLLYPRFLRLRGVRLLRRLLFLPRE